ncbi:MAG: DUF1799 domain-containing protein [Sulfuricaulis sp.]|nr:DUF1799 domain-containing protein [Sulfuricaulis sp.]
MWPENWEALQLFLACGTQWRFTAQGRVAGLNYPSLESVMRLWCVPRRERAALLDRIRVLESAALRVFNTKR